MRSSTLPAVVGLLLPLLLSACTTLVPSADVAWRDGATVLGPADGSETAAGSGDGYLKVETDTDVSVSGSLSYDYKRRPYDLYSPDGKLLRADVENRGWRSGQDPVSLPLRPGRYVVASMYGAVYRKVQVDIRSGETTLVPEDVLSKAPRVFAP